MSRLLTAQALTAEGFAPFGEVIEVSGKPDKIINQGMCGRHHDLAKLDFGPGGRAGISLFDAQARHLPHTLDMVERHPEGSQAFVPVSGVPMLVVVAEDGGGTPVNVQAFISKPHQSINLRRGVWHGVLCPLGAPGQYVVIDRIGETPNLQEHWFTEPYTIVAG
ncbi:ureidoglycolate lyase [Cribrihabitans neustonicus]|uniref:ureidoglycolate lyase n=1 Tax=Cribrihabitans neustonicus TaxID=1429085 RepID=UPI003B5C3759